MDGCEIRFAPPKKPWLKPEGLLVLTGESGIIRNQGFLNGAKWISSIHSRSSDCRRFGLQNLRIPVLPNCGRGQKDEVNQTAGFEMSISSAHKKCGLSHKRDTAQIKAWYFVSWFPLNPPPKRETTNRPGPHVFPSLEENKTQNGEKNTNKRRRKNAGAGLRLPCGSSSGASPGLNLSSVGTAGSEGTSDSESQREAFERRIRYAPYLFTC